MHKFAFSKWSNKTLSHSTCYDLPFHNHSAHKRRIFATILPITCALCHTQPYVNFAFCFHYSNSFRVLEKKCSFTDKILDCRSTRQHRFLLPEISQKLVWFIHEIGVVNYCCELFTNHLTRSLVRFISGVLSRRVVMDLLQIIILIISL